MKDGKKILLIGPQGSGKSTQASLLSEFLNLPVVSTGDIFRDLSVQESKEGKRLKYILDEGKLVDDKTTSKIVEKRLSEHDFKSGFIMDGYPRNIEQVNNFDPNFDTVFYLEVPEDISLERLLKRGREDDSRDSIKTRLELYYKQTQPLLEYYKNKGILVEIDGEGSIKQVQQRIKEKVNG